MKWRTLMYAQPINKHGLRTHYDAKAILDAGEEFWLENT